MRAPPGLPQHGRDEPGDPGLLVERLGSLRDGRAIEFSQSFYRGDIYDFVAELSDMT
jgi:GntR family transcriptional regulator